MNDNLRNFLTLLNELQEKNKDMPFEFLADSRKIKQGDVFVALEGEKTDGHLFINQALDQGAALVLASKKQGIESEKIFYSENPLKLLKMVCEEFFKKHKPIIIGITGSCGKTSTKAILYHLLKHSFPTFVTKGNANSQIGLPLALMDLKPQHKLAVLEIGMSHKGEILRQVDWIPLNFAIITSIGLSHVENFTDGIYGIAKAKGEILEKNPDVLAFYNDHTNEFEPFKSYPKKQILLKEDIWVEGQNVFFHIKGKSLGPYPISHLPIHMLENLHLALACAIHLGASEENLYDAICEIKGEDKRLEVKKINQMIFVDDSYNASPSSMEGAINYIKKLHSKRKLAVIGSMKELGEFSKNAHIKLAHQLNTSCDKVYCIGEETLDFEPVLKDKMLHFKVLDELKNKLLSELENEDLVLIKGSHSTGLFELFEMIESNYRISD